MADASKLAAALQNFHSEEGLAPYGIRHSGEGVKGKGYFGTFKGFTIYILDSYCYLVKCKY